MGLDSTRAIGARLRYALRTMAGKQPFSSWRSCPWRSASGPTRRSISFMDSLLLRSLPVSDPESLVLLNWHAKTTGHDFVMKGMSGNT